MKGWLKWSILSLIFIIVVLGVLIYFILDKNNYDIEDEGLNIVEENVVIQDVSKWTDVPNISSAYSIEQCIQKFYNYVAEGNIDGLYNCLDKEYVTKNGVTKENLLSLIKMERNVKFVMCDMQYIENQNITAFQIEGLDIRQEATKKYYIVKVDFVNNYFSIYPINKKLESVELTDTVNHSEDSVFESINLTEVLEAKEYLINFKYQALYNSESLFNKFDKQVWSSYDEFKSFVDGFKFSEVVSDYSVKYNNSDIEYFITDSLGNKLAFTVKSAMNYSVRRI